MSTKDTSEPSAPAASDDEIRDYAYHLYVENGHRNDQRGQQWMEAKACLQAGVSKADSLAWLRDNPLKECC